MPTPPQSGGSQPHADAPGGAGIPEILDPLCAVFRRKLRSEGLKYTSERARLLDTVLRFEGVFVPDQVLEELRRGGVRISKATVYRTIRLLQDAGIIQRVPFDDEQSHFHVVYGGRPRDLVVRLDTKEAIEVDVPELLALRDGVCKKLGLKARGHRLQIFATASESGRD